jgi:hypothetical protein
MKIMEPLNLRANRIVGHIIVIVTHSRNIHIIYNLVQSSEIETICVVCLFWLDENHLFCLITSRHIGRTRKKERDVGKIKLRWTKNFSFFSMCIWLMCTHNIYLYAKRACPNFRIYFLLIYFFSRFFHKNFLNAVWRKTKFFF